MDKLVSFKRKKNEGIKNTKVMPVESDLVRLVKQIKRLVKSI